MRRIASSAVVIALLPSLVLGQEPPPSPTEDEWKQPPLVETPANAEPSPAQPTQLPPATPPQTADASQVPPGPEIGLMVSESAFGMLTAAGTGLLLYFLALKPLMDPPPGFNSPVSPEIGNIIFLLAFGALPLSVAQTQVRIANGSYYYTSESWPAALAGLAAEGAVLGLYFLTKDFAADGGEALLLIGSIVAVPLVQMAVINLTKQPRYRVPGGGHYGSLLNVGPDGAVSVGLPMPRPTLLPGPRGLEWGARVSLLGGRF